VKHPEETTFLQKVKTMHSNCSTTTMKWASLNQPPGNAEIENKDCPDKLLSSPFVNRIAEQSYYSILLYTSMCDLRYW